MTTTFTLYCSECQQNQYNKKYPIQKNISSCEDLKEAVRFDHICAACKDFERKNDNFLHADCSMFDIDNTESDNPSDWVTLETVRTVFPDVPFYVFYSRNHMKPKGNKAPRPKFHVYFPHQAVSSKENYKKLKEMVCAYFKAFDQNAKDVARFFFGVEQPQVEFVEGSVSLLDFMDSMEKNHQSEQDTGKASSKTIPEGVRNTTMSKYASKVIKRWGNTGKAYSLFLEKSKQCVPHLSDVELNTIWNSALRFCNHTVFTDPNYIPPGQYQNQRPHSQYCLEVKDYLAWNEAVQLVQQIRKFTLEAAKNILNAFSVSVYKNDMNRLVEVRGLPAKYNTEDAFPNLVTIVMDTATKLGYSQVQQSKVYDYLSLLANENHYHPVVRLLDSTVWDKQDRMPELYRMMGLSDDLDKTLVRKWALQTMAVLYNDQEGQSVSAQGLLVLQGNQGVGKTELFRHLAIEEHFFKGGATLDMSNKDSMMSATKVWICELGEIDATTKKEQSALKAFLTEQTDHYREPYARFEVSRPRRTSFCGTVNPREYLTDPTGNRRFWTVHVEEMDVDSIFKYTKDWYAQLWKQIEEEYKMNPKEYLLTPQEQEEVCQRNKEYEASLYGEDEFLTMFDVEAPESKWQRRTAAEIAELMNTHFQSLHVASSSLGKSLLPRLEKRIHMEFQRGKSNGKQWILCPPLRAGYAEEEPESGCNYHINISKELDDDLEDVEEVKF